MSLITPHHSNIRFLTQLDKDKIIWIDCEMREKDEYPTLTGLVVGDSNEFQLFIHDNAFNQLVDNVKDKSINVVCFSWKELVNSLIKKVENEGFIIAGYSSHEYEMINNAASGNLQEEKYLNANISKWWKKNRLSEYTTLKNKIISKPSRRYNTIGLKDFLRLNSVGYNYPKPPYLNGFSPASAIKRIRQQSASKDSYLNYSKGTKRSWTNLVAYNRHDVLGMRYLIVNYVL